MKIIKSHITYEEVKNKREELHTEANIRTEIKEETIHILKRLPFFIIFAEYSYFIFTKCCTPVYLKFLNCFKKLVNSPTGLEHIIPTILSLSATVIVIGIAHLAAYKFIFYIAKKFLPRHTPITDRNEKIRRFERKTKKIEDALKLMNKISTMESDDIEKSEIILEEGSNEVEFILRYSSKGLTMKEKHILSKRMVEKLHDSGELDFTLIDEKWNELLEKYEIN